MSDRENQMPMRLPLAPARDTLDRLFQVFGDELIPVEDIRVRYFRSMNAETFKGALGTERIPLPVTTLALSQKADRFIHIRALAAYIEYRAWDADQQLADRNQPGDQTN